MLQDSPSHYWKLNETSGATADDAIGSKNLTGDPGPTWGIAGPGAGLTGASFTPLQKMWSAGTAGGFIRDNMSLEFWFFTNGTSCGNSVQELVGFDNFLRYGATSWGLYLYATPCAGPPTLRLNVRQVDIIGDSTTPTIGAQAWYHVVATRAGGVWSLYLNGSLVGTSSSGVPTNSSTLWIAQDFWGEYSGFYLSGGLTRLAFYDSVLAPARVSAHYQAGIATITQPPSQTYGTCSGAGSHALAPSACTADPVNSLTGAYTTSATDLSLSGVGVPFAFARSYTSADGTVGRLGSGWTDSYSTSLAVQPSGDVLLHGEEGQQVAYTLQPDGSFEGAAGALSTLTAVAGGYELVTHDQVAYQFDSAGVLESIRDRNDEGLTFSYTSGKLTGVTDSVGRAITLAYNGSDLLSSVSVPDGRVVSYGYTDGRLTSVTLPDPDGTGPLAAPVWTYGYDADGRLATEVDPNNHPVVTNVYDPTTGRVT